MIIDNQEYIMQIKQVSGKKVMTEVEEVINAD